MLFACDLQKDDFVAHLETSNFQFEISNIKNICSDVYGGVFAHLIELKLYITVKRLGTTDNLYKCTKYLHLPGLTKMRDGTKNPVCEIKMPFFW